MYFVVIFTFWECQNNTDISKAKVSPRSRLSCICLTYTVSNVYSVWPDCIVLCCLGNFFEKFKFRSSHKVWKVRQGRIIITHNIYMYLLDQSVISQRHFALHWAASRPCRRALCSSTADLASAGFRVGYSGSLDGKLGQLCINYFCQGSIYENKKRGSGLQIVIPSILCQGWHHLNPVALFSSSIFSIFHVNHFHCHHHKIFYTLIQQVEMLGHQFLNLLFCWSAGLTVCGGVEMKPLASGHVVEHTCSASS